MEEYSGESQSEHINSASKRIPLTCLTLTSDICVVMSQVPGWMRRRSTSSDWRLLLWVLATHVHVFVYGWIHPPIYVLLSDTSPPPQQWQSWADHICTDRKVEGVWVVSRSAATCYGRWQLSVSVKKLFCCKALLWKNNINVLFVSDLHSDVFSK